MDFFLCETMMWSFADLLLTDMVEEVTSLTWDIGAIDRLDPDLCGKCEKYAVMFESLNATWREPDGPEGPDAGGVVSG